VTAITFPLKKFPGQFSHSSMVYTGRASAHIVILTVSAILHGFLVHALQVRWLLDALLYSLPMLGPMFFQAVYLVKVKLDDDDYFDMSLKEIRERYDEDGRYFYNMGVLGFFSSVASVSYASLRYLHGGLSSPLVVASNACLLLLMYYASLRKGLYTNERIAVHVFAVAVTETAFIVASTSGMYTASFAILCATAAYFLHERSKGHSLYGLLQDIIK
jgi:hypothetical protein